jgi:hypothetical protein
MHYSKLSLQVALVLYSASLMVIAAGIFRVCI